VKVLLKFEWWLREWKNLRVVVLSKSRGKIKRIRVEVLPKSWLEKIIRQSRTTNPQTINFLTANHWLFIFLTRSTRCDVLCLFCRKMSKLVGKLKRVASFRSTRSSSSRGSTDMQIDTISRCQSVVRVIIRRDEHSPRVEAPEILGQDREGHL
jgi:hypothetical protein